MSRAPRGFTLVEVVVVLLIVGLLAGMSGLAVASLSAPRTSQAAAARRRARADAIEAGVPVRIDSTLFLPDGRAFGPGADPLTGAPRE